MSDPRERHLRGGRRDTSGAPETDPLLPEMTSARAEAPAQADELRELREVVSLLRTLPEPEPPEGLVQRVMERVAEIESRPRYASWRREVAPVAGAALAAGIAGLLFFAALAPRPPTPLPSAAPVAVAGPHGIFFVGLTPAFGGPEVEMVRGVAANPIDLGLDRQLNLMQLDPQAFFQRLERVPNRDRYLARLALRAAARGDAPQVAMRLRSSRHDLARNASDQFLRASLVNHGAERR